MSFAMARDETPNERIREYLRRLTPQARSRLLAEVERLQLCGGDMPGSDFILAELRAEFRNKGQTYDRLMES
jgi:hypothetical protein